VFALVDALWGAPGLPVSASVADIEALLTQRAELSECVLGNIF
jgi:hypothetical protein